MVAGLVVSFGDAMQVGLCCAMIGRCIMHAFNASDHCISVLPMRIMVYGGQVAQ